MRNIKRGTLIGGTTLALIGGGIAFAAWTSTGTGSGDATAGTAGDLTVSVGSASGLYPTGSVTVPFTVTNDNDYEVTLSGAEPSNFTVDAGHSTCNVASVDGVDVVLSDVVAAAGTSASRNVTVTMSNAATDACQGATFAFDLLVSGASSGS